MANQKKTGLGRGLSSLLGGDTFNEADIPNKIIETKPDIKSQINTKNKVLEVPIVDVIPNPNQPRTNFKQQELEELSESIKRHGLIQPIVVSPIADNKYEVIAGERRLRASKMAGLKEVPIVVKETTNDKKLELALIENIQREDLNPMEEAYTYKRILEAKELSHAELASLVSKGRSTITNALRLLDLPEKAQKLLYENKITSGHARAILSVTTDMGKDKLTNKIVEDNLSVREAETLANLYGGGAKALKTVRLATPKSYKKAANVLKNYIGNNVKVKRTKDKNKIEILFDNEKDLERIIKLIIRED